jgi:DNA modification methylase
MPEASQSNGSFSTAQVARMAGVHRDTLLRWLRARLIAEPRRDRRGWRVFNRREANSIIEFAQSEQSRMTLVSDTDQSTTLHVLDSIDWNFTDAKTDYLTHRLHPYPAKFIPQIPNALIQELSSVGERVAEIFCGSGTTLVEALMLKRNAVGIDANPLACLISQAKTTLFGEGDQEKLSTLVERANKLADEIAREEKYSLFKIEPFRSDGERPRSDAINFWFEPFVVEELAELLSWCRQLPTESSKTVALAAFSSIVVTVSKQDSDTRYVRREKKIQPGDALRRFAKSLADAIHCVAELTELSEPRFVSEVIHANVLDKPDIGAIDLVVCSPPYPNAFSYHLYHMTRMLWLGMDQPEFKKVEIGSHRKYSSRSKKKGDDRNVR